MFFIQEMGLDPTNPMNFEPHFMNALMLNHQAELLKAEYTTFLWITSGNASYDFVTNDAPVPGRGD